MQRIRVENGPRAEARVSGEPTKYLDQGDGHHSASFQISG
jgi:hypothetical protein